MAVIVGRALKYKGISGDSNIDLSFTDKNNISDYAAGDVKFIYGLGILSGDDNGNFMPKDSLTRAQAAKVISIILERSM